ncbi:uncharacterized protein SPSK_06759 [Sporothrix schenckii 1099-18]|uniref:Uncharacterized protein n=1 Tax=Sporothrix schenckii 1099-18 TaxID=1397361 RepID=A0A0F2MIZ3_SPOSC|nr:uncharacterized protein SPSK_06759 [Sporothrix schenckii 1099-18]KJR89587.1 hypothetical protein SPSK_06759 [Sporothrix schenckii 1099-18]
MATQSAPRRVTFIVNDDDEKFIIVIPEEIITADQLKNVARNFQRVADEDCSIVYDSETRTFRLSQMADGEALEAPRYTLVGHAKGNNPTPASKMI